MLPWSCTCRMMIKLTCTIHTLPRNIVEAFSITSLAEEDGYDWGGTMGGEQVHYNRDLLKESHSRGGGARAPGAPLVPPPMHIEIGG